MTRLRRRTERCAASSEKSRIRSGTTGAYYPYRRDDDFPALPLGECPWACPDPGTCSLPGLDGPGVGHPASLELILGHAQDSAEPRSSIGIGLNDHVIALDGADHRLPTRDDGLSRH